MQHLGEEYFEENGEYYQGNKEELLWKGADKSSISFGEWCENFVEKVEEYNINDSDYIVLTDEEADDMTYDYCYDIWEECYISEEFKNSFLYNYLDLERATKDTLQIDGRASFLASYDGEENEETIEGQTFYIYRIN